MRLIRRSFILLSLCLLVTACTNTLIDKDSSQVSAEDFKTHGVLFFQTSGGWPSGHIQINGKQAGAFSDHFAAIKLPPGQYLLTRLSTQNQTTDTINTQSIDLNIRLTIEAGKVTSIGNLVFIKRQGKTFGLYVKNNHAAKRYIQLNIPQIYPAIASDDTRIINADVNYYNGNIIGLREALIKGSYQNLTVRENFVYGDLGIAVDNTNPRRSTLLTSPVLERLSKLPTAGNKAPHIFLSSLNELFIQDQKTLVAVDSMPDNFVARNGFSSDTLVALENNQGDLNVSFNQGKTWQYIDTPISSQYVETVIDTAGDQIIFGTVTAAYNQQSLGFIVDPKTGAMEKIGWSRYVTPSTQFLTVNNHLLMNPTSLDDISTSLFKYIPKTQTWRKLDLPNRSCVVGTKDDTITLSCIQDEVYQSKDSGETWQPMVRPSS